MFMKRKWMEVWVSLLVSLEKDIIGLNRTNLEFTINLGKIYMLL